MKANLNYPCYDSFECFCMKLILIDGGPASGKNTLGMLLVKELNRLGNITKLLDLDSYVEELNPNWTWDSKKQKENDQLNARINFTETINKFLQKNFIVIAIGEKFLTKGAVVGFISKLKINCPVYLYHLSSPFSLRKQRLHQRGPHSLIDLDKDQKERNMVEVWPGYIYENINSPEIDALNIAKLIREEKGLIDKK